MTARPTPERLTEIRGTVSSADPDWRDAFAEIDARGAERDAALARLAAADDETERAFDTAERAIGAALRRYASAIGERVFLACDGDRVGAEDAGDWESVRRHEVVAVVARLARIEAAARALVDEYDEPPAKERQHDALCALVEALKP